MPGGTARVGRARCNLPARAWVFGDFLADVLEHGLTEYNKNYLNNIWTRALIRSVMVRDRGHETIKEGLRALVSEVTPGVAWAAFERRVHDGTSCWRGDPTAWAIPARWRHWRG